MMQIGMIVVFFTSYPANIFLLKTGWKEKMPLYQEETARPSFPHGISAATICRALRAVPTP
jgi:hypothetical protein